MAINIVMHCIYVETELLALPFAEEELQSNLESNSFDEILLSLVRFECEEQ